MFEHVPWIVVIVQKYFGVPLCSLLGTYGLKTTPELLFPGHIVMAFIIVFFLLVFLGMMKKRLSIYPNLAQYFMESYVNFISSMVIDTIGEKGKKYIPCIGTLGIFILLSNLLGLIPGLTSPTSNINITAGCALFVFMYYHWQGIKEQGMLRYIKHFMGPFELKGAGIAGAALMFPIELIGHFARPLSLSMRLFGNIFGEDLIIIIFFSLIPLLVPLPMMCLAIFTSLIQTLVFVMLSTIYIAGAVAVEEHH